MKGKLNDHHDSNFPTGLAQPALRALRGAGYTRLEQLAGATEAEVKQLHGIGPNALHQLSHALNARGLSFAQAQQKEQC